MATRVDAVEAAGDPQRLDVVAAGDRVRDRGVADRRTVAARAAAHHEVLVVRARCRRRRSRVMPPTNCRLSSQRWVRHGSSWLVWVSISANAVAVLAGDLAAGVHDEQLAAVVGEHERLHGEVAVDADAAGEVVDEAGDERAGGGVHGGEADRGRAVDRGELAADVDGGVRRLDRASPAAFAFGGEAGVTARRWSG